MREASDGRAWGCNVQQSVWFGSDGDLVSSPHAQNNASNRSEFLTSLAEKKRVVDANNEPDDEPQ